MAALMLSVPPQAADSLKVLPVPLEDDPHVTIIYLGDDVPVETLGELVPTIYGVTSSAKPFLVSTQTVGTFPEGNNGVPVIALVEAPALHQLKDRLCAALDSVGYAYDKKFPEYKPHVTLAYGPSHVAGLQASIPPVSWDAMDLWLWGANRGTGELLMKFPFGGTMTQAAHARALVKLASWDR